MKKLVKAIVCIVSIVGTLSCTAKQTPVEIITIKSSFTPESIIPSTESYLDQYYGKPVETTDTNTTLVKASSSQDGIDLDLTKQSPNMIYAHVYNMMLDPDSYIGKTIKMKGICSIYHDPEENKDYYACIVKDALACCAQGIDFEMESGTPYPAADEEITILGVFEAYTVKGYDSFHIARAKLN